MSNQMSIVVTNAGIAEVINAEQSGTAPVVLSQIAFGTGQYTASPDQTQLVSEFKRFSAIAGGGIGDNLIHLTVADSSAETYTVYEVGVFSASGTLFAVYSQTTPIVQKSGLSEVMLAIDILLTNIDPESVTVGDTNFVLNPATTSRQGIVELATSDETISGTDSSRAITPAGLTARTATTGRTGLVELATAAEAIAGTDASKAVTPSSMVASFISQQSTEGFQKLPNGFILQWGRALVANGASGTQVLFPTTFPNACRAVTAVSNDTVQVSYTASIATGNVTLKHNGNGGAYTLWTAIGN